MPEEIRDNAENASTGLFFAVRPGRIIGLTVSGSHKNLIEKG